MTTDYEYLIEQFLKISQSDNDSTFLEISGYPHYENVCSNILAFYLDPSREHNLSDLVLSSLLALSSAGKSCDVSHVNVEREVASDHGRIDLVVTTDNHIVAIENKIFHMVNNPFDDYIKKIEQISEGKECVYVLLTLREESTPNPTRFQCITYPQLFGKIKEKIGLYIQGSNNKYLLYLTDFMTSLENLISGSTMNKEVISFFARHEEATRQFIDDFKQVERELRAKIDNIRNNIDLYGIDLKSSGVYRESNCLADCIYHDLILDGQHIAVDCYIRPTGWEITLFPRQEGAKGIADLSNSLNSRGIVASPAQSGRLKYGEGHEYDFPIEQVTSELETLIKTLSQHNAEM